MSAEYITSLGDVKQLEKLFHQHTLAGYPQARVIFAGRSNVGKSSLLNALTKKDIAHVSKQAGKTRKINFFLSKNLNRIIVDLPGYGYAKRSSAERKLWAELIQSYISADEYIQTVLLLSDSRHGPTEADIEAIRFFNELNLSTTLVLTKTDQLKNQKMRAERQKVIKSTLKNHRDLKLTKVFWASIKDRQSIVALLKYIGTDSV